jgi:ribosomal protein L32
MPAELSLSPNPDFHADFSHGEAVHRLSEPAAPPLEHHCQVCPTCGHRLNGHRCKLVCAHCGYYMSCADYY